MVKLRAARDRKPYQTARRKAQLKVAANKLDLEVLERRYATYKKALLDAADSGQLVDPDIVTNLRSILDDSLWAIMSISSAAFIVVHTTKRTVESE